ncbi:MAG: hypothetical protein ACM339_00625, partial [Ignavibacteria bacterium]
MLAFFTIAFFFILTDIGICQVRTETNLNKVPDLKKDSLSGSVKFLQAPVDYKKITNQKRFDKLRIRKDLEKLKKLSEQHAVYEKMYKLQKQAEKEK